MGRNDLLGGRQVGELCLEPHGVLGARVIYARAVPWGEYKAFLRGDNLLDRDYAGSVIVNEGNGRSYEPGAGRSIFVGLELVR